MRKSQIAGDNTQKNQSNIEKVISLLSIQFSIFITMNFMPKSNKIGKKFNFARLKSDNLYLLSARMLETFILF